MPSAFIYLGVMLAVIIVWFMLLKRPVYEAVLISFLILLTATGKWANVFLYIDHALSTSLLYSMVAFVAMSVVMAILAKKNPFDLIAAMFKGAKSVKDAALAAVKAEEKFAKQIEGKTIVKEIVVPDKLINIVVR